MQELAGYYVASDADSVLKHAKKLIGDTLRPHMDKCQIEYALTPRGKGDFGNLLEEAYFKIKNNSESGPDIPESGIEIKSTQLKMVTRPKRQVFKERLKISMIDYEHSFNAPNIQASTLWTKLDRILLMLFMLDDRERIDQTCVWADFLKWDEDDIRRISADWSLLKAKVEGGQADQLSEGDTWYLGACTAGAGYGATREAPGGIQAKVRAFSLKPSFLNYKFGFAKTVKGPKISFTPPPAVTLESYLLQNMRNYYDMPLDDIVRRIGRPSLLEGQDAKNLNSRIARALLEEIASERTDNLEADYIQFRKAGINERTVTLEKTGALRESVSFRAIRWKEIVLEEEWEDSELYGLLTTKFFFTVLKKIGDKAPPLLIGCFFWTMPEEDVEKMRSVWVDTRDKVRRGDYSDFPKSADHEVGHVRPHGTIHEVFATPQNTYERKKSFWLNRGYVFDLLTRELGI